MANIITYESFLKQLESPSILCENYIKESILKYPNLDRTNIEIIGQILFGYNSIHQLDFPVVTLQMGLGKSTLLHEYIQFMLNHTENYGAIVAVERVETIKELCEKYPETYYGLYGFKKEECILKFNQYNPNTCRICKFSECRVKQNRKLMKTKPVLVMTHARLHLVMNDVNIREQCTFFLNKNLDSIKRTDLFIDESPIFYNPLQVDKHHIKIFQESLHHAYKRDCNSRRELISYFEPLIQNLKFEMENNMNRPIINTKEEASVFDINQQKFLFNYYGVSYSTCVEALKALRNKGEFQNNCKIIPVKNELSNLLFRTYVLDGTADINPTYPKNSKIIKIPDTRIFVNTHVYIENKFNYSKERFSKFPSLIPSTVDSIRLQLDNHDKILLVTFKEYEDTYRTYFNKKELDRIYINHFNNIKGSNVYRDATCIFLLGNIYKGDIYYIGLYEEDDRDNIIFVNRNRQRLAYYKDTNEPCAKLNTMIAQDQAELASQHIGRIKFRDDPLANCDVHLASTNSEYLKYLQEKIPSPNYHFITNKLTKQQEHFINTVIELCEENTIVEKSHIRSVLNMSDTMFKRYLKNENIKNLLFEQNIEVSQYFLEQV